MNVKELLASSPEKVLVCHRGPDERQTPSELCVLFVCFDTTVHGVANSHRNFVAP